LPNNPTGNFEEKKPAKKQVFSIYFICIYSQYSDNELVVSFIFKKFGLQ